MRKVVAGYLIHSVTAFGAIAGLISLEEFINGNFRSGLLWLIICQLIDGFDGPIARKIDIHIHATKFDGHILDLVVDYVTCVVVPVVMLVRLDLLTGNSALIYAGLIIFTGALWFARTDQETEDHWFNGFPAAWNLAIPTFIILGTRERYIEIIIVLLSILSLTKLKFPHLVKVEYLRPITWSLAVIYFVALTALSIQFPTGESALKPILVIFPIYIFGISIIHSWKVREKRVSSRND
ncbi:MAG: CDP-alcohol phosphatidyltransferase family protein [Candidatus Nanopelagicaceae bacterium]|jgi:phosphatidylcholine synthase